MVIKAGERVSTNSRSIVGTLVSATKDWATIRTDDGRMVNVRPANVRRISSGFRLRARKTEDESQYPPAVVALARANGVSCRQCAEWRPDLMK